MRRLEGLTAASPQNLNKLIDRSMIKIDREVKIYARSGGAFSKRSTGMLARKSGWKNMGDGSGVATAGVAYGLIQERGGTTKPHEIVAKARPYVTNFSWRKGKIVGKKTVGRTGGVLAFMIGGKMIFRKSVHHPGSKITGTHYTLKSYEKVLPAIHADAAAMLAAQQGGVKWP
jgi:hypothetical protein